MKKESKTPGSLIEEEFSIPLCVEDIIAISKEYNKLGWNIQSQIDNILELGIEEAIKSGLVKNESLPSIKYFFKIMSNNPYLGDAASIADEFYKKILSIEDVKTKQLNLN